MNDGNFGAATRKQDGGDADADTLRLLEGRLGRVHTRQRLGVERDHEAQVFGQGLTYFHLENSRTVAFAIRMVLTLSGLWRRGQRNAGRVVLLRNRVVSPRL
ncbi:MAG TPA: hypothetical protein VE631_02420, partial [Alphaproteobacteria bacterium]|nr:hypothetical protein [Alphaproteobacteria bacterium]